MIIIKALFFIFIIGVLAVGIVALLLINKVRTFTKNFSGQQNTTTGDSTRTSGQRTTQTSTGDTIIDTRSPDQMNKKIFGSDEGEYVEYEEKEG